MGRGIAGKIKINSFADIIGGEDPSVTEVPLEELHGFKGHPFRVLEDGKMEETVESIRENGVLMPGIVRPRMEGGYEIIAGHRRKRACELAGLATMPVLIKNYTDEEAVVAMVDTNIQREDILPSEKAHAYRMKFDAMKHQGSRERGRTLDMLGEAAGESGKTVQRYICLSRLSDALLTLVDERKMPITTGVDLSFLNEKEQGWVEERMDEARIIVSPSQATQLKEYSKRRELTKAAVGLIIAQDKPKQRKFVIKGERLADYFPEDVTEEEIEKTIIRLLDDWKKEK